MLDFFYKSVAGAKCSAVESETTQKNGVMPKDLNSIRSRKNFLKMICFTLLVGVFIFSGCKKPVMPGDATLRYETVPYVKSSSKVSAKSNVKFNANSSELDNLVFYDYEGEYNYYFFVLGHINSVPLAYRSAVYYNGTTPITIGYSGSNVTQISISSSVTEAFTHSVSKIQTSTWGNELGVTAGIEIGEIVKSKIEASYKHSWGGSESTDITNSRSFSNTFETSSSKASEIKDEISVTVGNNNEPAGLYRYSLFSTTDVYFVVVTDRAKTRVIKADVALCARPTQYWLLDYEPEIGGSFGKTASGALLQIPEITLSQLPDIEVCVHVWGDWIVTIAPTPTTDGVETRTCTLCQRTETRTIPAIADPARQYIDADGTLKTVPSGENIENYNSQTSLGTVGTTTWWRVSGSRNVGTRITINGDVRIILADGCDWNATRGINVIGSNSLTIYAQSMGASRGSLNATGSSNSAGIGGDSGQSCGNITINGGIIKATGANANNGGSDNGGNGAGAGIGGGGGGVGGNGGTIIINNGTVEATGGRGGNASGSAVGGGTGKGGGGAGAGIGGGGGKGGNGSFGYASDGGSGGSVLINNGIVTATGGNRGSRSTSGLSHGGGGGGSGSGAGIGGGGGGGGAGSNNVNSGDGVAGSVGNDIGAGGKGGRGGRASGTADNGGAGGAAADYNHNGGAVTATAGQ